MAIAILLKQESNRQLDMCVSERERERQAKHVVAGDSSECVALLCVRWLVSTYVHTFPLD